MGVTPRGNLEKTPFTEKLGTGCFDKVPLIDREKDQ